MGLFNHQSIISEGQKKSAFCSEGLKKGVKVIIKIFTFAGLRALRPQKFISTNSDTKTCRKRQKKSAFCSEGF